jgi:hypothetical protein
VLLAKIISKVLKPYSELALVVCQNSFRRNVSKTYKIFVTRNILDKRCDYNLILHQLFIKLTQAHGSVKRKAVIDVTKEYGSPEKLQNLVTIVLQETKGKAKVQDEISGEFKFNRALRQRNVLSTYLFNLILDKVIRETKVQGGSNMTGTICV